MPFILLLLLILSSVHAENKPLHWAGCGITKKAFMKELAKAFEKRTGIKIELEGGGATMGIRRVKKREVELGGSCRPKLRGVKEESLVRMIPVAWDALVVMVHPDNPVDNISIAQLKAIYEGKIRNWSALGGANAPIHLMVRGSRISGVGYTLRIFLWQNLNQNFKTDYIFPSSGPLEKAVEKDPLAIGVSGIVSAKKRKVKLLKLEGKVPNYKNIKNGDYLFYRPLYITYMSHHPRGEDIKRFIRFAYSSAGQTIIRSQGVIPYLEGVKLMLKIVHQSDKIRELLIKRH